MIDILSFMKLFYAILYLAGSYLLGSVPFAFILTKRLKNIDLGRVGSRNIGATNAGRVLGKPWFFVIMVLDGLKGFIPVLLARTLFAPDHGLAMALLTGFCLLAGHIFPVFLKFRGGKGVAVGAGFLLALSYKIVLFPLLVFLLCALITRYISLSSILLAVTLPVSALLFGGEEGRTLFFVFAVFALVVIVKHRENIVLLLKGKERRWGERIR